MKSSYRLHSVANTLVSLITLVRLHNVANTQCYQHIEQAEVYGHEGQYFSFSQPDLEGNI